MSLLSRFLDFLASGGLPMLPLGVTAFAVIALTARSWRALASSLPHDRGLLESRIDGVLFWGLVAAIIGVLGTLGGLAQMASAVEKAGATANAALIWGGVRVALSTTIVGISTLAAALTAWYLLRRRWLQLHSS